jgi:diguanylate cyclase (GGDEF)-like protein
MNKFNDANVLLLSLEKLIQSINNMQHMLTLHQLEAKLYEYQGNFKEAFYSYKRYKEEQEEINIKETRKELDSITSENMRNAINRLNVIADIGKDITSNLDVEKTVYAVYQHVKSLMKANIFGIAHLDEEELCYDLFIENNEKMPVTNVKLSDSNSFGVWCIKNDKEVIINDVEKEYRKYVGETSALTSNQYEDQNKNRLQSLMYVPLKFENKIVGIISVQSYDKDTYLIEDFETLKILATYVAIALRNARQSEELKILSTVDGLTNLYNRRYLNTQLDLMCKKSRDDNKKIGLMIIDIDYFKKVNDVYGHPAGDICLKQISHKLTELYDDFAEIVARIGGEEFAVLMYDKDLNQIMTRAEELRNAIKEFEIIVDNKVIKVTISIGISVMDETTDVVRETIFRNADEALYTSKNRGRNQVNIHSVN